MRIQIAAAIILASLSCGGGATGGSATLEGAIRGQSFVPRDATAGILSFGANGVPGRAAVMGITTTAVLCSLLPLESLDDPQRA
jgi:hypothetical protein